MASALVKKGWHLSAEGVGLCGEACGNKDASLEKAALDLDLKRVGSPSLPDGIQRGQSLILKGPLILQVQKVRNVAAPKSNQTSMHSPRMLKLQLTDGHLSCSALEMTHVPHLKMSLLPGSKIQLLGDVEVDHGFILLHEHNVRLLGGKVEGMIEKWELSQKLATHVREGGNEGVAPPPWVPFSEISKGKVSGTIDTKKAGGQSSRTSSSGRQTQQRNSYEGRGGRGGLKSASVPSFSRPSSDLKDMEDWGRDEQPKRRWQDQGGHSQERGRGRGRGGRGQRGKSRGRERGVGEGDSSWYTGERLEFRKSNPEPRQRRGDYREKDLATSMTELHVSRPPPPRQQDKFPGQPKPSSALATALKEKVPNPK
ncbi:tudor domain-containing protein 3-like [Oscarella lobularis]|uniref:tudor domain-containing protein 3-like n=1 Tax=Oscarella lobularis TaxID=121494 RepID=UPI003313802B